PRVLLQLDRVIRDYKHRFNVAAIKTDLVAHSMGGDLARSLRAVSWFASDANFSAGNVHKLITIGTPHLGTPIATQLLRPENSCVTQVLAKDGSISISTATLSSNETVDGGVGDLQ